MSRRRSPFVHLFFALLLLFAQQQATLHALGHDIERIHAPSKDTSGLDDAFCAKCLAIAHLDHVDGVAVVHVPVAAYASPTFARVAFDGASPTFVGAYRSRAPPVFS